VESYLRDINTNRVNEMTTELFIVQKYNGKKYIATTHKKFIEERLGVEEVKAHKKRLFKKFQDGGYMLLSFPDKSVSVKLDGKVVRFASCSEAFYHHLYRSWLRAGEKQSLAGI
jgi:hypothetical protein